MVKIGEVSAANSMRQDKLSRAEPQECCWRANRPAAGVRRAMTVVLAWSLVPALALSVHAQAPANKTKTVAATPSSASVAKAPSVKAKPPRKTTLTSIPDGGRVVPPAAASPLIETSAAEQAFLARMDAILAPVYGYSAPDADLAAVREALQASTGGAATKLPEIEARVTDPVARKLVRWIALRSDAGGPSPADIEDFRRANPDFAEQNTLRARAEEALLTRVGDSREIKAFFAKSAPQTGAGLAALAAAHLGEGDRAKAQELSGKAWREHDFSLRAETVLLNTLGGLLTEADHKARLDRLLMRDIRWAKERAERAQIARRIVPYLSEPEQIKAQARLAVYLRQNDAARAIMALPAGAMNDWGVYYSVVQLNRRAGSDAEEEDAANGQTAGKSDTAGKDDGPGKADTNGQDGGKLKEAWRLLLAAPTDPAKIVSPDDWWIERRVSAYAALRLGQPKTAYELVREAGPLGVNALKDQQMLAGWIALRQIGDIPAAERHFKAMRKAADGPISTATAEYWLARTALAAKDRPRAELHLRNAVPYFDTYYGQLARQTLDPASTRIALTLPPEPTAEEQKRFLARDAVKAVIIARRAGAENLVRPLLAHLRYHLLNSPGEVVMIAHLAHSLGDTQWSLRTAKAGLLKGHNLVTYAFPTHAFPAYTPLRPSAEPAFLLGIARQESEFNTSTFSGAGARGVLQVMPVTARHICRDYKVKCEINRLSSDAGYNAMIASAYIGDRLADYAGSYIMTLAGYNAGPGRVRQWVREFGDPRSPEVDPIDWVERIPFEETREYVKKVLANIQVYRARVGQPDKALRIVEDLNRARMATEASGTTTSAAPNPAPPRPK